MINVYGELHGWPHERSKKKAGEIYDTLLRIFDIAKRERIPTYRAADRLAEERIAAVAGLDRMWMGGRTDGGGRTVDGETVRRERTVIPAASPSSDLPSCRLPSRPSAVRLRSTQAAIPYTLGPDA